MVKHNVYFVPEKVIKIHKMAHEQKSTLTFTRHSPTSIEDLIYFTSRCLELNRRLREILKEEFIEFNDMTN
jgi:hypothetical protein